MEIWKTVIYDGEVFSKYEVSNYGNVRNVKTKKIRKQRQKENGYIQIYLIRNDGTGKGCYVHRLVAYTFIENNDHEKTEINHIDEDKTNNHVDNLEWCTREYNMSYGTIKKKFGNGKRKKVMGKSVNECKVLVFKSAKQTEKLGFTPANVTAVCRGLWEVHKGYTWKYIYIGVILC